MRKRIVLVVVLVTALAGSSPKAATVETAPCTDTRVDVDLFLQIGSPVGNVLENLGFDGLGAMWISNSTTGRVHKIDPGAADLGSFPLPSPGALTLAADGTMMANYGNALVGSLLRTGQAGVVRFDPGAGQVSAIVPTLVASGLDMANGGIFDPAGNYYVSNDVGRGIAKIGPDGIVERMWAPVWGANGLVVAGDALFAAVTFDQRSPIARVPLADPSSGETWVHTTYGVASLEPAVHADGDPQAPLAGVKGLDDMTLGPDGHLWVTANGTGEILRVHPGTGAVCKVADGLRSPSSIRFASSFGPWTGDAFVTEFSGAIKRLRITGAAA